MPAALPPRFQRVAAAAWKSVWGRAQTRCAQPDDTHRARGADTLQPDQPAPVTQNLAVTGDGARYWVSCIGYWGAGFSRLRPVVSVFFHPE